MRSAPQIDSDYIIVGKIGSPYGVKGWLKIFPFTASPADLTAYDEWYIESPTGWQPFARLSCRVHGKGIIANIETVTTPELARRYTEKHIAIKRTQLPALPTDEFYWVDLIGLTMINQKGDELGKISSIMATGANDVLIVKGPKEHAVPYLPGDVVKKVDLANKLIYVDWEII
jgi:16S rRNA processing protein RimM